MAVRKLIKRSPCCVLRRSCRALLPSSSIEPCCGQLARTWRLRRRLERQHAVFSPLDACTFAVNIYDAGATLSIVADTGAHGTHVAGIAAACHPEAPGLNGVAPGAQIVSCKIGDTRLSGMETGPGLLRGIAAARRAGAHIINMSYGEPTSTPDCGRFVEVVNVRPLCLARSRTLCRVRHRAPRAASLLAAQLPPVAAGIYGTLDGATPRPPCCSLRFMGCQRCAARSKSNRTLSRYAAPR